MTQLILLGPAREAAGIGRDEVPGETVGEILDAAAERYGTEFARVLARSQVWVNSEPASRDSRVGPQDEVSVLPPVSGGCAEEPSVRSSIA